MVSFEVSVGKSKARRWFSDYYFEPVEKPFVLRALHLSPNSSLFFSFLPHSSLVIRDLTLRSAGSFGMFHLMRLLCDGNVHTSESLWLCCLDHWVCTCLITSFFFFSALSAPGAEYIFFLLELAVMNGEMQPVAHMADGGAERKVRHTILGRSFSYLSRSERDLFLRQSL